MKELGLIQSSLNAPKGQYHVFGKYNYRSCEDILAALKPLLKKHECTLTISDDIVQVGVRFYVKATANLTNSKGEQVVVTAFAREEDMRKGMDASQVTSSASSYARKYALNGLFAIDDTKDADALNATPQYTQQARAPFPPPQDGGQAAREASETELLEAYARPAIQQANGKEELLRVWNDYPTLQGTRGFMSAMTERRKQLGIGK